MAVASAYLVKQSWRHIEWFTIWSQVIG